MPSARQPRLTRLLTPEVVAVAITLVVVVVYAVLIRNQDEGFTGRRLFVLAYLLAVAGVLFAGTRAQGTLLRAALLGAGANSLILVGFLALFSVGFPLIIAGLIAMPALGRALTDVPRPAGPAVVGLATLISAGVMIAGLLATA